MQRDAVRAALLEFRSHLTENRALDAELVARSRADVDRSFRVLAASWRAVDPAAQGLVGPPVKPEKKAA
jgi:hypothetical protein